MKGETKVGGRLYNLSQSRFKYFSGYLLVLFFLALSHTDSVAEPANPFAPPAEADQIPAPTGPASASGGGFNNNNRGGTGGNLPTAPLSEEEDVIPEAGNFGFTPPPGNNNANNGAMPVPPPDMSEPKPLPRMGVPPKPITASGATVSGKNAPKLADYLELDSSVKGLEVKNFDFADKDIKDLVTTVSKLTGKNFILDSKVRGKITIIGPSQVTLQEAYNAFLSALDANNLTTVQSGKFIRVIDSAEARRSPVKTYAGDYAPKDDGFITRIFQLKYINADEVQREFRDLTTRQGKLFAYEPTNSIIITDTGSNIGRIREILDTLDVKNFETTLHVLRIKNTSAKNISEMLSNIYGDEKGGQGRTTTFRRNLLDRTRGGGIITKIIPDEQTNSLIVLANQSGYMNLQTLVGKLDVRVTDTGKIHVYYCEYAKAEDLAATLAALTGGGSGPAKSSSRNTSVTSANALPGSTPPPAGGGSAGPTTATLEGGVKVTADAATNSLVIVANASDYKTMKRVIRKLDIPRQQVLVETAILEVAVNRVSNVGVNMATGGPGNAYHGGFIGDPATLGSFLTGGIPQGATIPLFLGPGYNANVNPTGTSPITAPVATFMGLINLLTTNGANSILSTPQIIALDNEKAEFKVQDEIPVIASSTAATATSGVTQNVTYIKTGIEVKLTPHINATTRTIRLEIEQTVDSLQSNANVPTSLQGSNKAKTSRGTNTVVVIRDSDYVLMGGLMSDSVNESVTKVPLLGDIPVLGWLFKSKNIVATKSNLIILLHPRIIGTSIAAADMVADKLERRDDFIERNANSGDIYKDNVREIRSELRKQKRRGEKAKKFEYRNNDEDDDDYVKPGEQSELKSNDDRPRRARDLNPDGFQNLPSPGNPPDNSARQQNPIPPGSALDLAAPPQQPSNN